MKKSLFLMCVAVMAAFASCKKEETPVAVLDLISAPSETTIAKEGTEEPLVVTFKASKAWTASSEAEYVTLSPKSGDAADECKVKINVPANETTEDRAFTVVIASEGLEPIVVKFKQNCQFHMSIEPLEFEVTTEGGEFTVNINANVEYTVTDYSDGSFPWQHAVPANDGKSYKVTIDANTGYDARTSYVKFKTSDIQVPVIDEESGEPTEQMEDLTIRVYFNQKGLTTVVWESQLPETVKNGTQISMAKAAGMNLLYDGAVLYAFDPATGKIVKVGEESDMPIVEIANDDAGNLILASQTNYGEAFDVFVVPAGTPADAEDFEPIVLIHSYFDYYGYGMGHFQAKGDVLKDGIVTALIADGPAAGIPVTGAYWEIKDGKATTWAPYGEEQADICCQPNYVTFETAGEIWIANRAAFAPLGPSAADGFLYNGYDGTYALQYHNDGFATPVATIGDWANGVSAIQAGVWGENPVVAINNMAWFPQWAMPSVLTLFDATTMSPITTVSLLGAGLEATYMAEPSTCIMLEEANGDLVIYSADGAQGLLTKILVPAK